MAGVIDQQAVVALQHLPVVVDRGQDVGAARVRQDLGLEAVARAQNLVDRLGVGDRRLERGQVLIALVADDQPVELADLQLARHVRLANRGSCAGRRRWGACAAHRDALDRQLRQLLDLGLIALRLRLQGSDQCLLPGERRLAGGQRRTQLFDFDLFRTGRGRRAYRARRAPSRCCCARSRAAPSGPRRVARFPAAVAWCSRAPSVSRPVAPAAVAASGRSPAAWPAPARAPPYRLPVASRGQRSVPAARQCVSRAMTSSAAIRSRCCCASVDVVDACRASCERSAAALPRSAERSARSCVTCVSVAESLR